MTSLRPQVPPRVALVVFLACAALAVWTLHRTLATEAMASRVAHQLPVRPAAPAPAPGISPARLAAAVKKDPFRAERRPPTERFQLPGDPLVAVAAHDSAGSPFQLIGTAVMTEGRGFAMCQWGTEPPKLVRVGERVGELTLKMVAQGRAIFTAPDGRRTELRVPKAGT